MGHNYFLLPGTRKVAYDSCRRCRGSLKSKVVEVHVDSGKMRVLGKIVVASAKDGVLTTVEERVGEVTRDPTAFGPDLYELLSLRVSNYRCNLLR